MKVVIQRVSFAQVEIDGETVSEIDKGLLVLLGIGQGDNESDADILVQKLVNLRIFSDENDKMNYSLLDINGDILVVSQFTLFANCIKGRRPDFFASAKPDVAKALYLYFVEKIKSFKIKKVGTGVFGADMKVSLTNDGPVTIILDSGELKK